jgi:DnaJ-class molecular chaperone
MPAKIIYIEPCPSCKGKGKITYQMMYNAQVYAGKGICARCKGRGMIVVKKEKWHKDEGGPIIDRQDLSPKTIS